MKFNLLFVSVSITSLFIYSCDNPPKDNEPDVQIIREEVRETTPPVERVEEEDGTHVEFNVKRGEDGGVDTEVKGKIDLENK